MPDDGQSSLPSPLNADPEAYQTPILVATAFEVKASNLPKFRPNPLDWLVREERERKPLNRL